MKNIKTFLTASIVGAAVSLNTYAQQVQGFVHQQSEASGYVWPTDEQVLDKLAGSEIRRIVPLGTVFRPGYCRIMVYLL